MDLGARSGCYSNVTEVRPDFFFHLFTYYFGRFVAVVSLVSVVSLFRVFVLAVREAAVF